MSPPRRAPLHLAPALLLVGGLACSDSPSPEAAETTNDGDGWSLTEIVPLETDPAPLIAHPRPVIWEIEPLNAHGGMPGFMIAGVERLLREHAPELDATYREYLAEDPMLCGEITAHITTESGVFLFCSLEDNTTGSEALGTALFGQMQGWDWPSAGRDVFRLHLYLRRSLGDGRGFADAGSQQLRPLPPLPPPDIVEPESDNAEEPDGPTEVTASPSADPDGVGSTPEAFQDDDSGGTQ